MRCGTRADPQAGFPDLDLDARMRSDPGSMPFYYDFRLIRWDGRDGWSLHFLHHKLILDNQAPEIQDLQFTHGYNMVSLQRLWDVPGVALMVGAGVDVVDGRAAMTDWSVHFLAGKGVRF